MAYLMTLLITGVCSVWSQPYRVGVFDAPLTGGMGASAAGFVKVFKDLDEYSAQRLSRYDPIVLYQYDIIILYDVHKPGQVTPEWLDNVYDYVRTGGSVLNVYHQHHFSPIGPGVLKVYVPRVRPVGEHSITDGIDEFRTQWGDHIILRPGKDATVFLENTRGEPVAAFGPFGEGKVISCGLALGIRRDWRNSRAPAGTERKLLRNMLRWLQPSQRWTEHITQCAKRTAVETWLKRRMARQPEPIQVHVTGSVPQGAGQPILQASITDQEGNHIQRSFRVGTSLIEPIGVNSIDDLLDVPTEGLVSGAAKVRWSATAGEVTEQREAEVRLVRTKPPDKEFRAFWIHAVPDRLPADIMPRIRACGFNAVIPRVSGGTGAFYLSKVLPDVQNLFDDKDWMAECVEQAHGNDLQVHAYRNCFIMEGRASKETIAKFERAGRLQAGPDGQTVQWLCPSQEVKRQVELAAASELVRDYDIDGFQFDFIRYPGTTGCYCSKCREKLEKQFGRSVEDWPRDVREHGPLYEEYTRFRQQQITETVEMVSAAIREIDPSVKISAAVFRDYDSDSVRVAQDWVDWAAKGYVDFLCPMTYTEDVDTLDELTRDQVARAGEYVPICAGLGLRASSARMETPQDLALQIDVARQAGAKGFALFCWYPGCDERIVLKQREDSLAGTPPMPWE